MTIPIVKPVLEMSVAVSLGEKMTLVSLLIPSTKKQKAFFKKKEEKRERSERLLLVFYVRRVKNFHNPEI
jgi:hypothetical protein